MNQKEKDLTKAAIEKGQWQMHTSRFNTAHPEVYKMLSM
jgi:hypothetical protein